MSRRATIAASTAARSGDGGRAGAHTLTRAALHSAGHALPAQDRSRLEPLFGVDLSRIRIHDSGSSRRAAQALGARGFAVGAQVHLGTLARPDTLVHELAHAIQQRHVDARSVSLEVRASPAAELQADRAAAAVMLGRSAPLDAHPPALALQALPAGTQDPASPIEEPYRLPVPQGTMVSKILVDLRRSRVGFQVPAPKGMILGAIATDLRPGEYQVRPDFEKQEWVFRSGQTREGLRFHVELEGASPWSLGYPEELPVSVGQSVAAKGQPRQTGVNGDADWVRYWDELNAEAPGDIPDGPTIDAVVDWQWDAMIEPGATDFSEMVLLRFIDGTSEWVALSDIDESTDADPPQGAKSTKGDSGRDIPPVLNRKTTPQLVDMKRMILRTQKVLRTKWDAELLTKELETFPTVFSVLASVGITGKDPRSFTLSGSRGAAGPSTALSSLRAKGPVKPVNGIVNVGGALEEGSAKFTNLNPIVEGTGGATRGIPNHIKAGFEQIDQVIVEGSASKIISRRLPSETVDWPRSALGAYKVLKPGGLVRMGVAQHGTDDSAAIVAAFQKAGFKNVKVVGEGMETLVLAER